MTTPRTLRERAEAILVQCGACDAGLPMMCVCPNSDPRAIIAELLAALDQIKELTDTHNSYARSRGCDLPTFFKASLESHGL